MPHEDKYHIHAGDQIDLFASRIKWAVEFNLRIPFMVKYMEESVKAHNELIMCFDMTDSVERFEYHCAAIEAALTQVCQNLQKRIFSVEHEDPLHTEEYGEIDNARHNKVLLKLKDELPQQTKQP